MPQPPSSTRLRAPGRAVLGMLLLAAGCGDESSAPSAPTADEPPARIRLAEHLVEAPPGWSGRDQDPISLSAERLAVLEAEPGVLMLRLPWPARPGSELRLVADDGREARLEASPRCWTAADESSGLRELCFAPGRFRIEAEAMRREDSAEVSHAATMAAMIALPDGSSLLADLPPLASATSLLVVARASGKDVRPIQIEARLRPDDPEPQILDVGKDWRPLALRVPEGLDDLALQLTAKVPADQADRRLVVKRIEVTQPLGDLLLARGDEDAIRRWREDLAEGRARVMVRPDSPGPTTRLIEAAAFSWRDPGEATAQVEHWVWMQAGELHLAARRDARVEVEVEGLELQPDSEGRWRSHNPEAALRRVRVRALREGDSRELRVLQPAAAVMRRREADRLPEPLFGEVAARDLHRLEFGRERKACWILGPGDRLRFRLPANAPRSLRWDQACWSEGSAMTELEGGLRLRVLDEDGAVLDEHDAPQLAPPEKKARWESGRFDSSHFLGGRFLEIEATGEAFRFGEDGRLIHSYLALAPPSLVDPAQRPGGVILYCIDTLRADHLSLLGHDRPTTPFLEEIEGQLLVFEDGYSTCSWTRPSTASLLTGLHPAFHGATGNNVLATEVRTLAEQLHAAGHATGAVVTNPNVSGRNLGFEEGFEDFHAAFEGKADLFETSAESLHPWIEDWLRRHAHEPFFLYIHSVDPHSPYTPPEEEWRRFDPDYSGDIDGRHQVPASFEDFENPGAEDIAHIVALYDAEIVQSDRGLRRLVHTLQELELWDRSGWWLTSDHGEEFQERGGWLHGRRAWQEQIHVPFLLKPAAHWDLSPRRLVHRAQISDIAPSLCELLGVVDAGPFSGDSLVPVLRGDAPEDPDRRLVLDERPEVHCVLDGPLKLIVDRPGSTAARSALYHLRSDPEERQDLAATRPEEVDRLQRLIDDRLGEFIDRGLELPEQREKVAVMSQEEIDTLMALGYLDAPPTGGEPPPPSREGDD